MPAIRYRYNNVCAAVLEHLPTTGRSVADNIVEVRMASGSFERLPWRGFICTHALPFMGAGRFCKIICAAVTDGNGLCRGWRTVGPSDYALGWLLPSRADEPQVHGIVGRDGFPIVVHADGTFSDSSIRDYVRSSYAREARLRGGSTA